MDTRNYEQTFLGEKVLGEAKGFLKEQINVSVLFYNGKAIGVTLPNSVDLKVAKCDPGVRGDTVSGALKPATLETGYVVNVPLFINEGDVLKIDTRDGKYLTRVATGG
jgi:elongation factor P